MSADYAGLRVSAGIRQSQMSADYAGHGVKQVYQAFTGGSAYFAGPRVKQVSGIHRCQQIMPVLG